jgi:fatty acid synthase subunit alpha
MSTSTRHEDLPLGVEEFLRIVVALKAKKGVEEVPASKSIKEIAGGKSTLQNEILADLQKEFGDNFPERSEELPLSEVAVALKTVFTKTPGRYSAGLISKMLGSKMPPGFSINSVRDLLDKEFGLGSVAADQILIFRCVACVEFILYFSRCGLT